MNLSQGMIRGWEEEELRKENEKKQPMKWKGNEQSVVSGKPREEMYSKTTESTAIDGSREMTIDWI